MALASCSKWETKWLTVEEIGKSTISSFFSEVSGLTAAGEGMHSTMLDFYNSDFILYAEIAGEMLNVNTVNAGEGDKLLFDFALAPEYTSTYPRYVYRDGFAIVTAANNILYYGPKLLEGNSNESEIATINKVLGWGYFARALAYFDLCLAYGQPYSYTADASHLAVPLVTVPPGFDDELPRKSVATVYEQVISDLNSALEIFGDEASVSDCYHASGIASEALLARVYLYKGDYEKAKEYASKVMGKVQLSPRSEYVAMFRQSQSNPGTEAIFRLNTYDHTNKLTSTFDPTATQDFYPTPDFYNYFDSDDIRAELLTYIPEESEEEVYQGHTYPAVCKFLPLKSISDSKVRVADPFVLRVSEMYLIHAEACAELGDLSSAEADLRALQARARGKNASEISLFYSGKDGMLSLIKRERLKELSFEGHGLFDITRRGEDLKRPSSSNASVTSISYPDHRFVLPFDEIEMQCNEEIIQNEGY